MIFRKWIWVFIQSVLMGAIIFLPRTTDFYISTNIAYVAYTLELLGFLLGLSALYNLRHSFSAAPQPVSAGLLEVRGVYAYIRHPMYSAVFLIFLGITIKSTDITTFFLFLLLVVFFFIKTRYEEKYLREKYSEYSEYEKKVGRFLPKLIK